MNLLQTISLLCFLGIVTNCKFTKKDIATFTAPQLDSLFVEIQMRDEVPTDSVLTDSLLKIYIDKADKFPPYHTLSSSFSSYKAFLDGFYQLNKDTYGKIVSFEPDLIADYSSVQLFIENNKGDILDAIELAYEYGEEGSMGFGTSYIVRRGKNIKIFTKKFWIDYAYYLPDEREETDLIFDTLMVHEIRKQQKVSVPIDSSTKVQMEKILR